MCNKYSDDGATHVRRRHKTIALFVKSSHFYCSIKFVRFFEADKSSKSFNVFWRASIYWYVLQVAFCSAIILIKMPWAFLTWCTASVKINFLHGDVLQWRWRQGWEPAFRPERYVTQYPVLFSHLNAAQTLACKRARENHEKSERLSPFLQLIRSKLMLFPFNCCPQSHIFPPLNSVCMSYLCLSYVELICCNIKQNNPSL